MESLEYQDDLIRAILEIVQVTPFGVLCFLPSYSFLNKLVKRMKQINAYEKLEQIKHIFLGIQVLH